MKESISKQPPAQSLDEGERLNALRELEILDTAPEERFDRITRLAQQVFGVPIALVSLVDERRQWFKSRAGLDVQETPREHSFCAHAIIGDRPMVVTDALDDTRFRSNPLVLGEPHIRFYAGCQLRTAQGHAVGTLCVIDRQPRKLAEAEIQVLSDLAALAETELNLKAMTRLSAELAEEVARRREAEARYRELLETVEDIVYRIEIREDSFAGTVSVLSRQIERTLGYSPEEFVRDPDLWFRIIHPDDRARVTALTRKLIDGADSVTRNFRMAVRGTREYRWLSDKVTALRSDGGKIHALMGVARDITNKRIAEERRREAEEKFRQVAENIREVFWITTADNGEMIYVSPAYEEIWGRPCALLYQRPLEWVEAIHEEDRERVLEAARVRQKTGEYREVYRIVRPSGEVRWVEDRAFPILNEDGAVYRIAGVAMDITKRKMEEARAAEATDRLVTMGTMVAGVAHEINNPLTFMIQNIDLAAEEIDRPDDDATKERLKELFAENRNGILRLREISRELKAFARPDSDSQSVISIENVLEEAARMGETTIDSDVVVMREFGGANRIRGNRVRLVQLFLNLIVNAGHALRDVSGREKKIVLRTRRSGDAVLVEVEDTGAGIPDEIQNKLFQPFFTTKAEGIGTGLGLSVCRNIAEGHRGSIRVASRPGKGTTFFLDFPAIKIEESPDAKPETIAPAVSKRAPATGTRRRILVVDDQAPIRKSLRRVLGTHAVDEASSAEEALQRLAEGIDYDVILSDINMPGLSGSQFYREVERLHADLAKKFIFMGGDSTEARAFLDQTGIPFLEKPFTSADLLELLARFLI